MASRADPVASAKPAADKIPGRVSGCFRFTHRTHPHDSMTGTLTMLLIHMRNRMIDRALSITSKRILEQNPAFNEN